MAACPKCGMRPLKKIKRLIKWVGKGMPPPRKKRCIYCGPVERR